MSNIGPLTTTFTPSSPDCLSSLFLTGNDIRLGLPGTSTSECLPSDFSYPYSLYYSPGICPSGYGYGCSYPFTTSGEVATVATCCPSGYRCRTERWTSTSLAFACVSTFPAATQLVANSYTVVNEPTLIAASSTTTSVASGRSVYAWGPIVRRASDDPTWPVDIASTASAPAIASSSLLPGSTAAEPTSTATSSSSSDGSSGLSTGAKAGIGVGVGVGGLLVIAACVGAFVLRRKRRRSRGGAEGAGYTPQVYEVGSESPNELPGDGAAELPASPLHELPGDGVVGHSDKKPAELPGR